LGSGPRMWTCGSSSGTRRKERADAASSSRPDQTESEDETRSHGGLLLAEQREREGSQGGARLGLRRRADRVPQAGEVPARPGAAEAADRGSVLEALDRGVRVDPASEARSRSGGAAIPRLSLAASRPDPAAGAERVGR